MELKDVRNPIAAKTLSSAEEDRPVSKPKTLKWTDLSIFVKPSGKKIVKSLSGDEVADGLWAIMGGSGSGKSTLLNCLSCRMSKKTFASTGSFTFNAESYDQKAARAFAGYVRTTWFAQFPCLKSFTIEFHL